MKFLHPVMRVRPTDLLRLFRIHTGAVTAAVPALGLLAAGGSYLALAFVVLTALAHHAWGFSLNEVVDLEVDKRAKDLSHKPLVSGRISRKVGLALSLTMGILSFSFISIAALVEGVDPLVPLILLVISSISGILYNVYGKRFPLSDVLVGIWMFFLVLSAASVSSGGGPYGISIWAVAGLSSVHLVFNNSVEGGIKDVDNDRGSGARTFAVVTGNRVKEGRLLLTTVFRGFGIGLRALFVISAAVFSYLIVVDSGFHINMVLVVSVLGILLFSQSLSFLKGTIKMSRKELLKAFSRHEIGSFLLCILVVVPAVGWGPSLVIFIVPALWFILLNRIVYGTKIAPGV